MRTLAIVAILVAGCTPAAKSPAEIQPLIAVAGTYAVIATSTAAPAPAPVQGDVCPACYGRGIVGDGKTMTTCQKCGGTGKVVKHPPAVIRQECKDGSCPTNIVR